MFQLSPWAKFFRRTPARVFILYPLIVVLWELFLRGGRLQIKPAFAVVMIWGYLQYRLCGIYRMKRGGGGPGLENPPERLVSTGPYAYLRNPMYLGHIIFLCGLALSMSSWLAALITAATAIWFHLRVLQDEQRLETRLSQPYIQYKARVKRWIPGLL